VDPTDGRANPTAPGATERLYWELVELMAGSVKETAVTPIVGACSAVVGAMAGSASETAPVAIRGP